MEGKTQKSVTKRKATTRAKQAVSDPSRHSKDSLLESKDFAQDKDILMAVLDDKEYTKEEARQAIEHFKKGKVK